MATKRKGLSYVTSLIRRVCEISGHTDLIEGLRTAFRENGILEAVRRHDDCHIFDWLAASISYQGISDQIAVKYMEEHGTVQWDDIAIGLLGNNLCPKLYGYWTFHGCGYRKLKARCNNQDHFDGCPLPAHDLRNGNLNQASYSLYLFMRDVAQGDLVGWIDRRLQEADEGPGKYCGERLADALVKPLRHVFGISDKLLNMTLADLLLAADKRRVRWICAGASMIAVDSLTHNWLHRSGCLKEMNAAHSYGPQCYGPEGCAALIRQAASRIDARDFNPLYPKYFPRFVQHAIWAFCAELELDQCNGRRIDDRKRCEQADCSLHGRCQRIALTP